MKHTFLIAVNINTYFVTQFRGHLFFSMAENVGNLILRIISHKFTSIFSFHVITLKYICTYLVRALRVKHTIPREREGSRFINKEHKE